jgi:hypothetical protein
MSSTTAIVRRVPRTVKIQELGWTDRGLAKEQREGEEGIYGELLLDFNHSNTGSERGLVLKKKRVGPAPWVCVVGELGEVKRVGARECLILPKIGAPRTRCMGAGGEAAML